MKWRTILGLPLLGLLHLAADAAPLDDPTQPMDPAVFRNNHGTAAQQWKLTSTLVGNGRRIAIIDGIARQEGDRMGDARIVRITSSTVYLESAQRRITLRLVTSPVRSEPHKP